MFSFYVSCQHGNARIRCCGLAPCCWATRARQHTHTRLTARFSGTTRYQKGKTNLDFTQARDSEWQWHQLDHMQVCTSLQTDNHASTPPLSFYRPIDRYLVTAERSAANPPHVAAAVDNWDRQTDTVPLHRTCRVLCKQCKQSSRRKSV